jgi:two-component system osmolarity sensor histidine kinase EnvZ
MTLWPRTLLARSVLMIALVLVVAHLAWLQIFRISAREPRAHQLSQQIVSIVNLTRVALVTADPAKRYNLLRDIAEREGIEVHLGVSDEKVAQLPDSAFYSLILAELRHQLGDQTKFTLLRNGAEGVWVSFRIDEEEYWVVLPESRLADDAPLRWIGWGVLVLLLALAGAFLVVARINRPLRELTRAAAEMGRGATPAPVTEGGPEEIRTLARSFNQMASDLRKIDEERALLLAGVSHDLRTPLARIRLGLEMLDTGGDPALREGIMQDIGDIDAAIGQFLDFARASASEEAVADGDLNAIVTNLGERYRRTGKMVEIQTAPLPPLSLRPTSIQRVIANLIDNAIRHGGPHVEVVTGMDGTLACVEVLDRGPGIPPEQAERMLQPFTRLDSARSTSGTGLGLAIVDRIARMHGGRVHLLPREGGGLRARVEIPVTNP